MFVTTVQYFHLTIGSVLSLITDYHITPSLIYSVIGFILEPS